LKPEDLEIIDAHLHEGYAGPWAAGDLSLPSMLSLMDRLNIRLAVSSNAESLMFGSLAGLEAARASYEKSNGRVYYLGGFDPRRPGPCLDALEKAAGWPGFAGVKIHPSFHRVFADDTVYRPAWEFVAAHDIALLSHTWSMSDYNPSQKFATPERFEGFIRNFSKVRFVLGHAGGRGTGRLEVIRLANAYPSVFLDFAGDIFCRHLIEDLVAAVTADRILFGSDYPMMDPRCNLTRVLMANIPDEARRKILADNAAKVYRIKL
jgi:predicted TIM-barrel fold metal-dependent hydrolase